MARGVRRVRNDSGDGASSKQHLELELELETLAQVEALAKQAKCTPFQMCVQLIKEGIDAKQQAGRASSP